MNQLQTYIQELKSKPIHTQMQTPISLPVPKTFTYQASNLRSPFEIKQSIVGNKEIHSSNPLLIYPVSMLKFVGTQLKKSKSIAYIIAPDNKIYHVAIGDSIGDHGGIVNQIYADRIEIMEQEPKNGKNMSQRIVTLELKEKTK